MEEYLRRGALHGDEHDVQRTESSACEVDVPGVVGMHALRLASETPSALLDWNNNYGEDPDKAVCFHCCNLPKHFFEDVRMDYQEIIAGTVGKLNTFGTCVGRVKAVADELCALFDQRPDGQNPRVRGSRAASPTIRCETFGGAGVVEIPQLAGAAAIHLRERLRTPRGGEPERDRRRRVRGRHEVSGLGDALAPRAS